MSRESVEARARRQWLPWSWSYKQLVGSCLAWVLRSQVGFSVRAAKRSYSLIRLSSPDLLRNVLDPISQLSHKSGVVCLTRYKVFNSRTQQGNA